MFTRKNMTVKILLSIMAILLLLPLSLTGCTTAEEKQPLTFGDAGWDSIQVHNAILAFIVENGYDYPPSEMVPGSSQVCLVATAEGDIDIFTETWTENYGDTYTDYIDSGAIIETNLVFDDNYQGWLIPTYMIEGDAERGIEATAPNLKSVSDLPEYWELFKDPEVPTKGRFHNSLPGWLCTEHNTIKLESYGLDEYYNDFLCGSDAALSGSMVAAYEKGEAWLGYYWAPTWLLGKYDMTLLEEAPYDKETWDRDRTCAYMSVACTSVVHPSMQEKAPEIVALLNNYALSTGDINAILAYMRDSESDAPGAAIFFLKEYESMWTKWVPADIADKVKEALA